MIKLKILVASTYNDVNHQAQSLGVGDTLTTGEAYGRTLIESGLAEQIVEEAPVETPVEAQPEEEKKTPPRGRRRPADGNPFAPQK